MASVRFQFKEEGNEVSIHNVPGKDFDKWANKFKKGYDRTVNTEWVEIQIGGVNITLFKE